ncbi:MAG: hypothetical protein MJ099_04115 [Clostridia bacterium]|nr:hypothetical protein [Clostridia bacterium]
MNNLFAGGISPARVNPVGLVLMAIALVVAAIAGPVADKTNGGLRTKNIIKVCALLLCAAGALIAICA